MVFVFLFDKKEPQKTKITRLMHNLLYYWFSVGEGTLPLHHLITNFTPARLDIIQPLPPPSYQPTLTKKFPSPSALGPPSAAANIPSASILAQSRISVDDLSQPVDSRSASLLKCGEDPSPTSPSPSRIRTKCHPSTQAWLATSVWASAMSSLNSVFNRSSPFGAKWFDLFPDPITLTHSTTSWFGLVILKMADFPYDY
jgi:hypothetical protein